MKRHNKLALFGAVCTAGLFALASTAKAEELWDPHLRGVFEGEPAGALPPPGVYGILDNYFTDYSKFDSSGNKIGNSHLYALVEAPTILWVPGIKFLGADFGMAISQPFDWNSTALSGHSGAGNLGTFNTVLVPGMLSWALPQHFFVRTGLTVYLDDGTNAMRDLMKGNVKNGGVPSAMGYNVIEPDLGVSWLNNGWDISIATSYSFPISSDHTSSPTISGLPYYTYRSGPQFGADYTVTKTIGHWTAGLGGETIIQLTKDTLNGNHVPGSINRDYGFGPIVGYQWSNGIGVTALWNHQFGTTSEVGGDFFDVRFMVPLL